MPMSSPYFSQNAGVVTVSAGALAAGVEVEAVAGDPDDAQPQRRPVERRRLLARC